jgi:geranylgeranyl diphosphate synthase type II
MDKKVLETLQNQLTQELEQFPFGNEPHELYEPIRYILKLGGKRLRPILCILTAKLFTDDYKEAIAPSLAIEIFHNFTLMHDDIMDDAPLRRGQTTVHEKWNLNIAILSGDVMMVRAYDALMSLEPVLFKPAIQKFNACAAEVCEGQQYDMNFEALETVSTDEYINMIRLKTAVLLGFSQELGAIIGGASEDQQQLVREFGTLIGIGFQLKDDLLDVFGEQAKVGKQIGGDIISNKKTYLLIKAQELAQGNQRDELNHWLTVDKFDNIEKVKAVTAIYTQLGIKTLSEDLMQSYFKQAFEKLATLDVSDTRKKDLIEFTQFLINRDH